MVSAVLIFGIAGLAAASPLTQPDGFPPMSTSKGFRLIINATDTSRDFKDNPVHGQEIGSIHIGATTNALVPGHRGGVFYETGPIGPDYLNNTLQAAMEGPEPYGLVMDETPDNSGVHGLVIRGGLNSSLGFGITGGPHFEGCPALGAPTEGTFAICDTGFGAPAHPQRVLEFISGSHPSWYSPPSYVPANCVAVHLLVQCDTLDLSGATYPHDRIWDSRCYTDVAAIKDWRQYAGGYICYN